MPSSGAERAASGSGASVMNWLNATALSTSKSSSGSGWRHNAPPSMVSCVPVTYFDSSDARYTTPAAMSARFTRYGTTDVLLERGAQVVVGEDGRHPRGAGKMKPTMIALQWMFSLP